MIEDAAEKRASIKVLCEAIKLEVATKRYIDFANKFYAILPTELRHVVYQHIWNDKAFSQYTAESLLAFTVKQRKLEPTTKILSQAYSCPQNHYTCFQDTNLPAYVRRDLAGLEVAKEVVTMYYRVVGIPHEFNQYNIKSHLLEDQFHLHVSPVGHIRRIEHEISNIVKSDFKYSEITRRLEIVNRTETWR